VTPGPVLLVTGATSGIGEAVANFAARSGYRLGLAGRDGAALAQLVARLGPDTAIGVPCDVTRWDDVEGFVEATRSGFGRIDGVFANAGTGAPRGLLSSDPRAWPALIETNVLGVAYTLRAAVPHVCEAPCGHVILMGSVAGRWVTPGSLYAATKAAVAAMADALRQELRDLGDRSTRVTLIEAGWVSTRLLTDERPGAMPPAEIAEAVLYALERPAGVDVNQITVRPTTQRE
jgi:NADP-dependent 3-hydroxy acid dehydrogenase YdfG